MYLKDKDGEQDSKRKLQDSPFFTDGQNLYIVSRLEEEGAATTLVLETYDSKNLGLIKSVTLLKDQD